MSDLSKLIAGIHCVVKFTKVAMKKNDTQVRPETREHNEFHQFRESGKSDILLGRHVKER